jgi:hypothetical protein
VNDAEALSVDFVRDIVSVISARDGANRPSAENVSERKLTRQLGFECISYIPGNRRPRVPCETVG